MTPVWLFGAGGHAKVVIDTIREDGRFVIEGLLDDDEALLGSYVLGLVVKGTIAPESVERFGIENAVIALGSNLARADVARRFEGMVNWVRVIHPRAYVAASARIGKGTVVFAGAVVQPEASIGEHVIVNTASSIDHDGIVGDFSHIAPGVRLGGEVRIKEGALLGVGANITPGRTVGAWATVGAGAVVIRDVPDEVLAVGVPAKPVARKLKN
jgi:sugar O-acyltransferase (sialic acid O-acetyltransferase NeuD family)